jgi:hypothetical protein
MDGNNYANLVFSNPVLIDIFSHHIENSVLASFIDKSGNFRMKFGISSPTEKLPATCEEILSLLFLLLESDKDGVVGKAYAEKRAEIMYETLLHLKKAIDGFTNAKLIIHTTEPSPDTPDVNVEKHTEIVIERKKS